MLSLFACDDEIKNPNFFVVATAFEIASLDPAYGYDTASSGQILNIYETLIKFDGNSTSEFVPCLATEWTISEDGKTYRFKIRDGVSFHNGNPLTPGDVEYSFERGMVQDYSLGPQWMFFEPLFGLGNYTSRTGSGLIPLNEIKNKVEVDGQWVQFNLATPYEPFLQILASSWGSIVDMDWCIANGDWSGTEESYEALNNPAPGGSPINSLTNGTGPFMLELWEPGIQIILTRNDNYWGTPASFEKVITQIIDEWATRKAMLELGDADCVLVPSEQNQEVKEMPGILVYENVPTLLNQALFFQFAIDPNSTLIGSGQLDGNGIPTDFFSDIDVRKGFAYAFDWDTRDLSDGAEYNIRARATDGAGNITYVGPLWVVVQNAQHNTEPTMRVRSVRVRTLLAGGGYYRAAADVIIQNDKGQPVAGAVVVGAFGGDIVESGTGQTNRVGAVRFESEQAARGPCTVTFSVDHVTHPDYIYDPDEPASPSPTRPSWPYW